MDVLDLGVEQLPIPLQGDLTDVALVLVAGDASLGRDAH